ncbi:hypothetical protein ACGFNU_01885 [Spirillospora sp. NPDC048911]|uniref:hypothetical protein n=1 Tax=Spirillospora sp. NPDC048911 TaxID=3364527 RepID=UPI003712F2BF
MRLPRWLLPHQVTVRAYRGEGSSGPIYAAPVTTAALIDDKQRLIRGPNGDVLVSATTLFLPIDVEVAPESLVEVKGRTATVMTVARRSGDGLPTPDHIEVALT